MIYSWEILQAVLAELKSNGKKVVFTNGCFDILHAGHVSYLADAAKLGDILVLGLNSDASVQRLKGPQRPVNSQEDRAAVLAALRSIDYIALFEEDTPFNLIKTLQPDVLVKGGDYEPDDIVGADIVRTGGGQVLTIPLLEGRSTTNIINKMTK